MSRRIDRVVAEVDGGASRRPSNFQLPHREWSEEEFLQALYECGGNINRAAPQARTTKHLVRHHRAADPMFNALVIDAIERGRIDHPKYCKTYDRTLTANGKPRKMPLETRPRPGVRKQDWRPVYLKALSEHGTDSYAAKAAGVTRETVRREKQRNEDFALQADDHREFAYGRVMKSIFRNAIEEMNVVAQIFLAKSLHPEIHAFETWKVRQSVELDAEQFTRMTNAIQKAALDANMSQAQQQAFAESLRDNLEVLEEQSTR